MLAHGCHGGHQTRQPESLRLKMEHVALMTDDPPIMFWSDKARATMKSKLSPLAIDWLSALMEVTEHKRKTT